MPVRAARGGVLARRAGCFILEADAGGAIGLWDLQSDVDIPAFWRRAYEARWFRWPWPGMTKTVLSGVLIDEHSGLWDVATCQPIRTIATGDRSIWGVALSRDSRTAVSTHQDGTLSVLDLRAGKLRRKLVGHGDIATSVALSPDDDTAISTSNDQTLRHWDLATGKTTRTSQATPIRSVTSSSPQTDNRLYPRRMITP